MARDPRTQRTVTALTTALRGALAEASLDDLSVSDLCRRAGVQRTTFYTHFAGVPELLAAMLVEAVDAPLALPDTSGMTANDVAGELFDSLVTALRAVADDRVLFRAALTSSGASPLRRELEERFTHRFEIAIEALRESGVTVRLEPVTVPFLAAALGGAVTAWAGCDSADPRAWAEAVLAQMPPWWPR